MKFDEVYCIIKLSPANKATAVKVDYVGELIHCKDCQRWESSRVDVNENVCTWGGYFKEPDDFCSWAKRRTDAVD